MASVPVVSPTPSHASSRATGRRLLLGGVIGPAAFTAAWGVGGVLQDGYPVAHEHISGLAAGDAARPWTMRAGFWALGVGTVSFAAGMRRAVPELGRAVPALAGLSGLAALVAGSFHRDTMLLSPPGRPEDHRQSWRNDVHDRAAGVAYVCGIVTPALLALRVRRDPALADLSPLAASSLAVSVAQAVGLGVFALDVDRRGNGLLQRVLVTLPLAATAGLALRLHRRAADQAGARADGGRR